MSDEYGILDLIMATYKDYAEAKELERFKNEYCLLLQTEAENRRSEKRALILNMSRLKIELKRFEYTYEQLVRKSDVSIPEVENYISDIQKEIKKLSVEKNK